MVLFFSHLIKSGFDRIFNCVVYVVSDLLRRNCIMRINTFLKIVFIHHFITCSSYKIVIDKQLILNLLDDYFKKSLGFDLVQVGKVTS